MDVASLGTIVAHRLTETEERYDILLLDYRLPGMHALDVLKELRQVHRLDLPVVLTTGHGDEEVALQALKLGAYDYVVKAEGYLLRLPAVLENAVYRVRLAREEARYRTLFENVPVGLYRTSLSGEILDANPALAAMLGYHDLAALRAVNANDLYLDPAQRGQQQALLEQEDTVRHYEMQMRRRDGRIIWVWDTVRAVRGSDGRLLWNEGSLEDITERKLAEDEIRQLNAELEERVAARTAELSDTAARLSRREAALQTANEKLKELDRLKSQFVSNVSHELRTPLTNITMYLHLLDHGKPERRAHYMTVLHNETVLLQRLIEDLLDLSQLDQGRARFDRTAVDVNRVLAMLVDARGLLASQRGLALEVQATPGLPHVLADATMLMQVLTNLLANALNYTPAGGRIELRSDLQEGDGQTWVTLAVSDSGLGLTAEDQAHIFERFYRGEAARQMGVAGTGLGLSICQEIIARHGGRISVQSAIGQGSTFTVWLAPCHRGSAVIESHQ
jgi:PAS domain S-box-containing protein